MRYVGVVVFVGMMVGASAASADPVFGLWQTQPDKGVYYHVQMQACGGKICGVFRQKFENGAKVASDVVGKNAMFDMVATGNGEYKGKAWRPSNGKTYNGSGTLSGNALKIGGCVLGGLICSKQTWKRLK
ncbi:DUF2147 domain-containing protein [Sulfitobacter sp. M57]|uniref:DUF2147 domain-containing protein n=1 Tax=unclassified Sulfitobacter TaxID=196795 RepID=UPI0023E0BBA0|nr:MULTISPECIES: DUF2147 domain-containing protein [unclassified Sulfitobacter]MDF3413202.1 DUF2147 domain-containing protein [Sulfitobacter sp. KE5]MDF3421515.1 DUF2147 domain-containing protein [Sulfitobacter sp. KE43]MDF3431751.1 DUF2147 domain-containing protein [Sulfitobacter sp. KE42]MDF3457391.1 DUF2147 domain-containing protein [Sulfitobacter sp. S74]MDF3461294.1 DUF2147 domain-containing protein [Sulfitobacter sp. Ks18]